MKTTGGRKLKTFLSPPNGGSNGSRHHRTGWFVHPAPYGDVQQDAPSSQLGEEADHRLRERQRRQRWQVPALPLAVIQDGRRRARVNRSGEGDRRRIRRREGQRLR